MGASNLNGYHQGNSRLTLIYNQSAHAILVDIKSVSMTMNFSMDHLIASALKLMFSK